MFRARARFGEERGPDVFREGAEIAQPARKTARRAASDTSKASREREDSRAAPTTGPDPEILNNPLDVKFSA
jgi:hypothetical protein